MPTQILMPPLSQTMDSLVFIEWLKQAGEAVTRGEVLYRVETDKATLDVEAPASGFLQATFANPGDEIKIHASIGVIAEVLLPEAAAPEPTQSAPEGQSSRIFASPRARNLASIRQVPLAELRGSATGPRDMIVERDVLAYLERKKSPLKATPVAERMSAMNQIDLATVTPSGPGGRITKADVEARLPQAQKTEILPQAEPQETGQEKTELSAFRQVIARRLHESHLAAVPVTYLREVDATRLVKLRGRLVKKLAESGARPTYTDLMVRILCQVLPRHPDFNATFDGETLVRWKAVHLALAMDTSRGLVAPVIRSAQRLGVLEIARARADLTQRAASWTFTPEELEGGTFTLTNLGSLGVDAFTPVINPPQTAILGMGRIRQAPAVHKGKLCVRWLVQLSLTCDHRVIDGAPAARFLEEVSALVETPDLIW